MPQLTLLRPADWYSTFAGLAGIVAQDNSPGVPSLDSINQWPVLSGAVQASTRLRNETFIGAGVLIQEEVGGKRAWKLIARNPIQGRYPNNMWHSGPLYPRIPANRSHVLAVNCSTEQPCLFEVVGDFAENCNVAADHPDIVIAMQARITQLNASVFEPETPHGVNKTTHREVCKATARNTGLSINSQNVTYLTPADYWTDGGSG